MVGESAPLPPVTLKYNTGKTAEAIEFWLRLLFEGEQPHTGTGWGIIMIEVERFRVTDVHGTVKRRLPKSLDTP